MIFGLIKPIFWMTAWSGIPFTLFAGLFISVGLVLIARFASAKSRNVLREFSGSAVRAERALRSEDSLLPLSAFRANSSD